MGFRGHSAVVGSDHRELTNLLSFARGELDRFRQALDQARDACDHHQAECPMMKMVLPSQANSIAEWDRKLTTGFRANFVALIEPLTHTAGRRTVVSISDGFSSTLEPDFALDLYWE